MLLKGSLDDRFFVMADRIPEGNCDPTDDTPTSNMLEYYECAYVHSTMVMYSQRTGAPLAALTLAASDEMRIDHCQSMITKRAPPPNATEAYFQGMLNIEGSFFEFFISNLSNEGSINFNILRVSGDASNPGPSYGINEVNELGPNKSCIVKADQQNKRRIFLRGKTRPSRDKNSPSRLETVSVQEAESGSSFQKGLNFCLSVVPEACCSGLVELFSEGTVWKVADGFVRKVNQPKPSDSSRISLLQPRRAPRLSASESSSSDSSEFSTSSRQRRSKCPLELASMKSIAELERTYCIDSVADQKCPLKLVSIESVARLELTHSIDSVADQKCPFELVSMESMGELERTHGIERIAVQKPEWKAMLNVEALYDNPSRSGCTSASMKSLDDIDDIFASQSQMRRRSRTMLMSDIGGTQATDLGYGEEIQVNSVRSHRQFDFDKASAPTVLCMSIWKEMSLFPFDISDSLGSRRGVRVTSHNDDQQRRSRLDSVSFNLEQDGDWEYQLESCLIDFSSPIDTFLVPCGHRCFNSANFDRTITRCPLCQTPISAVLPLSVMF